MGHQRKYEINKNCDVLAGAGGKHRAGVTCVNLKITKMPVDSILHVLALPIQVIQVRVERIMSAVQIAQRKSFLECHAAHVNITLS